jgi:ABC-2 type transport system permease protein
VVVNENSGALSYDYYLKSQGNGPDPDMLSTVFKNFYSAKLLTASGVQGSVIANVLGSVKYNVHQSGKGMLSGFIPAIFVSIMLFMSIYMYGYWVAMSIASEKTSRVMELLITSTKPSKIVIGKSLAMGLLGLLQLLIISVTSVTAYKLIAPKSFNLGGLVIDFSGFTPFYAVMIFVYFLLGFALYAMISAVAGATVSNAEDVRTAIMPVSMVAVISFYFAYGTIMIPDSTAAAAASMIPFSAPFSMPSRILMADVPVWQIAVSFGALAITTVLMAWVSIRLYSSAVLHYGKKLKISELIAMSKQ